MKTILHKLNRSPLWISFRDMVAYFLLFVVFSIFHDLRRGRDPFSLTLLNMKIISIIFVISWVAVYIGCRFGVTTITNGWGDSGGLSGRGPGTMVISFIIAF